MAQRMLQYGPMSRTALALVMVAASATAASAGGFVGLGVGTGAASSADFDIDENGRSGRLMLGYRFGRISVEGMGTRYDMIAPDLHEWQGTTLAIAGRYNFGLGDNFEVFPRLGLQRTSLSDQVATDDWAGTGFLVGGGAEYRIPLAATTLSVFVDYSILRTTMTNDIRPGVEAGITSRIWTLGAMLSF
jgi:hypothetical protein